jgi:hypothetical protein
MYLVFPPFVLTSNNTCFEVHWIFLLYLTHSTDFTLKTLHKKSRLNEGK